VYVTPPGSSGTVTPRLRLNVAQVCDRYPLDRFVRAVGAGKVNGPHLLKGERRRYAVDISGPAAHDVMERLRPYLTDESKKVKKYLEAVAAGASRRGTNGWDTGARRRSSAA